MTTQKALLSGGPHNGKHVPDPETPAQDFTINGVTAWYYRDLNSAVPVGSQVLAVYRHLERIIYRGGPWDGTTEENSPMHPGIDLAGDGIGAKYIRATEVLQEGDKFYTVYSYVEGTAYREDEEH